MSPLIIKNDYRARAGPCQGENYRERLRSARVLARISQDELGRLAGVDRSTISRAEGGYRGLSLEQKQRIAEALSLDLITLFGDGED